MENEVSLDMLCPEDKYQMSYIKHERQCFTGISKQREEIKRVENRTNSGVFLTKFEVFGLPMKHCLECLIYLLNRNKNLLANTEVKSSKSLRLGIQTSFTVVKCFDLMNY